jgi:hypothetical protein
MIRMLATGLAGVSVLLCGAASAVAQAADSAAFIVRLGQDTTAVERYVRAGDRIDAISVTRTPRTTVRRLTLWLGQDGSVTRFATGGATGDMREQTVAGGAIPIVNGFYVPWELVLTRAVASGQAAATITVAAGQAPIPIEMRRADAGTWRFSDQFGQAASAEVDAMGRMLRYAIDDGRISAERVAWLDIDAIATAFAARDEAGRPMGSLSPLDSVRASVGGASIVVEYSRPSLRGRSLDMLVPSGEVWRTGANNASTLETDRALSFGDVRLEPGTYSLFTQRDGRAWTLIFNRQTGMSGLARDPASDVGRVVMSSRVLDEPAETFTIMVEPTADGGILRLRWADVEASVPFRTN